MEYNKNNIVEVCPQILIYKNLLSNATDILALAKKSQDKNYNGKIFLNWEEWNATTKTPGSLLRVFTKNESYDENEFDSDTVKMEKQYIKDIYKAFEFARDDYLTKWAGKGVWPDLITNWNWLDDSCWQNHEFNILKYEQSLHERHNPQDGVYNLSMNYHVDANPANIDSQGTKLAITITMYLNNDYEGGEISFYDESTKNVYNYKPQPGDITVFSSFEPFYHGVLPMSGNPRYLIRMFWMYNFEGTESWKKEKNNYPEEEWSTLEKNRLLSSYNKGDHCIRILYNNEKDTEEHFRVIRLDKEPIKIE